MTIIDLAKDWSGLASIFAMIAGLAVARYQIKTLVSDVKDLKKERNESIKFQATQESDIRYVKEGLVKIQSALDELTRREYQQLRDAVGRGD